jgi:tetratricopeptide (TPR) repeat protein
MSDHTQEARNLRRKIERALCSNEPTRSLERLLEHLIRVSDRGTTDRLFAERELAELILEQKPWCAAMHIRSYLQHEPLESAGWALMGLSQSLLGNHRYAVSSFRKALAIDPGNPYYEHNLGHLLDVALRQPKLALVHLRRAFRVDPQSPIACSLIHALWRSGNLQEAWILLEPLLDKSHVDPEVRALAHEVRRTIRKTRGKKAVPVEAPAPTKRKARQKS